MSVKLATAQSCTVMLSHFEPAILVKNWCENKAMLAGRRCLFILFALPYVSCLLSNNPHIGLPLSEIAPSISKNGHQRRRHPSLVMNIPSVMIGQIPRPGTTLRASPVDKNELWDRIYCDEDPEPLWYLINCVATKELELLEQCQAVTATMSKEDVVKFVVPLESKTRSHGSKKIVTEQKVKFPGYVFAKLRLCPQTYEAIQTLGLCRSWMGTIHQKGIRKLPTRPSALNELEIEKFGLEAMEETVMSDLNVAAMKADMYSGVILDDGTEEDDDTSTPKVDMNALKVYEGLKVDDMVKVTNKGAFFNDDGVIRRLKDGKIFVRFYTHGQVFEQWMNPKDVRKLKAEEILKGLSGPTAPITQLDFDRPPRQTNDRAPVERPELNRRPRQTNDRAQPIIGGSFGLTNRPRNRRQDRIAMQYNPDNYDKRYNHSEEQENRNDYQDQRRRRNNDSFQETDSRRTTSETRDLNNPRLNNERFNNNRPFDGTLSERPNLRRDKQDMENERINPRPANAFIDNRTDRTLPKSKDEDFFASLMKDLNKNVESNALAETQGTQQSEDRNANTPKRQNDAEDDFFASLLNNLPQTPPPKAAKVDQASELSSGLGAKTANSLSDDDAFFASLEKELNENALSQQYSDSASTSPYDKRVTPSPGRDTHVRESSSQSDIDDFFASLVAEFDQGVASSNTIADVKEDKEAEEFFGHFASVDVTPPTKAKKSIIPSSIPSESVTSATVNEDGLAKKTIPELKEMLRERGLKLSGNKAELVERLQQST